MLPAASAAVPARESFPASSPAGAGSLVQRRIRPKPSPQEKPLSNVVSFQSPSAGAWFRGRMPGSLSLPWAGEASGNEVKVEYSEKSALATACQASKGSAGRTPSDITRERHAFHESPSLPVGAMLAD